MFMPRFAMFAMLAFGLIGPCFAAQDPTITATLSASPPYSVHIESDLVYPDVDWYYIYNNSNGSEYSFSGSFDDTYLVRGCGYYYTLVAFNGAGGYDFYSAGPVYVPSADPPVVDFQAGDDGHSIVITPLTEEAYIYLDYSSDNSNFYPYTTISNNSSPYIISGMADGNTWYFRVSAYESDGSTSSYGYGSVYLPPLGVESVSASLNASNGIDVSWVNNSYVDSGTYISRSDGMYFGGASSPFSDSGPFLTNTTYTYTAQGYYGAPASCDIVVPGPYNPSAVVSVGAVALSWQIAGSGFGDIFF